MPTEKLEFDCLYSYRFSMADNSGNHGIPVLKQMISRSLKFVVRYSIYDNLTFGTRIDYKIIDPSGSKGVLLLEDLNYRFRSCSVIILVQILYFQYR